MAAHVRVVAGEIGVVYALVGTRERYAGVLEHPTAGAAPLTARFDFRNTAGQRGVLQVRFAPDFQSYAAGWEATNVRGAGETAPRRVSGPDNPRCASAGALVLAVESGAVTVP